MATKKSSPQAATTIDEKSTLIKIAETIGEVAGEISVKKDQLTDMASNAINTVKAKIHDMTAPKVKVVKKTAKRAAKKAAPKKVAKAIKKVSKKAVKKVTKKTAGAKKAVAKTAKKVTKKVAPAKKAVKKVSRKK